MLYLSFLTLSLPAVGQEALGKATLSPPAPLLLPQLAHMLTIIYAVTSSSLPLVWMLSWTLWNIADYFFRSFPTNAAACLLPRGGDVLRHQGADVEGGTVFGHLSNVPAL